MGGGNFSLQIAERHPHTRVGQRGEPTVGSAARPCGRETMSRDIAYFGRVHGARGGYAVYLYTHVRTNGGTQTHGHSRVYTYATSARKHRSFDPKQQLNICQHTTSMSTLLHTLHNSPRPAALLLDYDFLSQQLVALLPGLYYHTHIQLP